MRSALMPEESRGAAQRSNSGMAVVIDGRQYQEGHVDAWRFGVVVDDSHAYVALVECQPRGRERKARRLRVSKTGLLKDTPELRSLMVKAGLEVPA